MSAIQANRAKSATAPQVVSRHYAGGIIWRRKSDGSSGIEFLVIGVVDDPCNTRKHNQEPVDKRTKRLMGHVAKRSDLIRIKFPGGMSEEVDKTVPLRSFSDPSQPIGPSSDAPAYMLTTLKREIQEEIGIEIKKTHFPVYEHFVSPTHSKYFFLCGPEEGEDWVGDLVTEPTFDDDFESGRGEMILPPQWKCAEYLLARGMFHTHVEACKAAVKFITQMHPDIECSH